MASTKAKFDYLLRRTKTDINNDLSMPFLLHFNYGTFIRARGEILIANDLLPVDWTKIMKMSDSEFCEYANVYPAKLKEL